MGAIPANDATGWGDSFRSWLLTGHDANGNTIDAVTVFNVKKYGAVGDGTTNDTTACQTALNAAVAAGGGIVYFPTGTYSVTGLTLTLGSAKVKVCGAGQSSVIKNASTGTGSTAKCGLYVFGDRFGTFGAPGKHWVEVSDLAFTGSSVGGAGLYLDRIENGMARNIAASGFTASGWGFGLEMVGCLDTTVVNPLLYSNATGLHMVGDTYQCNTNHVIGGWIYLNTGFGCALTTAKGTSFYNTIFEENSGGGCSVDSGCQATSFFGGWCESNAVAGLKIAGKGVLVDGMFFFKNPATASSPDIQVDATAAAVKITTPTWSSSNGKVTVVSGAANVTLWDEAVNTATVTDNSSGQFKKISSYLLTGG